MEVALPVSHLASIFWLTFLHSLTVWYVPEHYNNINENIWQKAQMLNILQAQDCTPETSSIYMYFFSK